MFRGIVFYLEGEEEEEEHDDAERKRQKEWIENQGGSVLSHDKLPQTPELFGHYQIATAKQIWRAPGAAAAIQQPKNCPVVLDSWLVVCYLANRRLDVEHYVISSPLNWNAKVALAVETQSGLPQKKTKPAPYSAEEDAILKQFATENKAQGWTLEEMWSQAESRKLLDGRSTESMRKRYAYLSKDVFDSTDKHYTSLDEAAICGWAWAWNNEPHPDKTNKKWEHAVDQSVVFGRKKADHLRVKYEKLKNKLGLKEVERIGKEYYSSAPWRNFFT